MQTAFDHLSANQPRKDAQAAKEDTQTNIIELNDARQHVGVVAETLHKMAVNQGMDENQQSGNERQEVNPSCLAGEEVSTHFNQRQARRLAPPQPPRLAGDRSQQ